MFYVGGRTDRQDEANIHFSQFCENGRRLHRPISEVLQQHLPAGNKENHL